MILVHYLFKLWQDVLQASICWKQRDQYFSHGFHVSMCPLPGEPQNLQRWWIWIKVSWSTLMDLWVRRSLLPPSNQCLLSQQNTRPPLGTIPSMLNLPLCISDSPQPFLPWQVNLCNHLENFSFKLSQAHCYLNQLKEELDLICHTIAWLSAITLQEGGEGRRREEAATYTRI